MGILDIGGAIQTGVGLGVPALLLGAGFVFPVANFAASLVTGLVLGLAIGYIIILARKFTINQSDSTYGADVMMGPVTPQAFPRTVDYPQRHDRFYSYRHRFPGGALLFYIWRSLSPAARSWRHASWVNLPGGD